MDLQIQIKNIKTLITN